MRHRLLDAPLVLLLLGRPSTKRIADNLTAMTVSLCDVILWKEGGKKKSRGKKG